MFYSGGSPASAIQPGKQRAARFIRLPIDASGAADMLEGCRVVTPEGNPIGCVEYLVIDSRTEQLHYIIVTSDDAFGTEIAIPWRALYFDSTMAQLVFYTCY